MAKLVIISKEEYEKDFKPPVRKPKKASGKPVKRKSKAKASREVGVSVNINNFLRS
ncbi:MAG: hypothetical protein PHQ00_04945 [Phycisphaerae bacterium]|nr:hypothetical protein [Phycisphaerae bacterium]